MKRRIDKDEWYPVWEFDETGRWEVEVSEELVTRCEAAFREFNAVQRLLEDLPGKLAKGAHPGLDTEKPRLRTEASLHDGWDGKA